MDNLTFELGKTIQPQLILTHQCIECSPVRLQNIDLNEAVLFVLLIEALNLHVHVGLYMYIMPFYMYYNNVLDDADIHNTCNVMYMYMYINPNSLSIVTEQKKSFKIHQLLLLSGELGLSVEFLHFNAPGTVRTIELFNQPLTCQIHNDSLCKIQEYCTITNVWYSASRKCHPNYMYTLSEVCP